MILKSRMNESSHLPIKLDRPSRLRRPRTPPAPLCLGPCPSPPAAFDMIARAAAVLGLLAAATAVP
eukprot:COSAG04_NODE_8479_length_968_cov_2.120829_1_plen_65_part_10